MKFIFQNQILVGAIVESVTAHFAAADAFKLKPTDPPTRSDPDQYQE